MEAENVKPSESGNQTLGESKKFRSSFLKTGKDSIPLIRLGRLFQSITHEYAKEEGLAERDLDT